MALGLVLAEAPRDPYLRVSTSRVECANALHTLGAAARVPLTADRSLGRRPFQIFVRNQKLAAVRREIAETLATAPGSCFWVRATRRVTISSPRPAPNLSNSKGAVQTWADLSACLEQVADQTGLSVLGDYDPCWDDYYSWLDFSRAGTRHRTVLSRDLENVPLWQALALIEEHFGITWTKRGRFIRVVSPRITYAELDGIDMLEDRPPDPSRFPAAEE